jgi:carbonic anhydrase
MSPIDDVIQSSEEYAESFDKAGLNLPAAKRLAVLACMDARLDVYRILGLEEGDAHVVRNAGGVVTDDAVRSLMLSQRMLGTEAIVLIHHTDCGMLQFTDDEMKDQIEAETGVRPPFPLGSFPDVYDDLRRSVELLRSSPFLPHTDRIRGFVYHVETGELEAVE